MVETKAQFMNKPRIRALPRAERERRWTDHLASTEGQVVAAQGRNRPARRRNNRQATMPRALPPPGYSSLERECVKNYTKALLDPFNAGAACIPTWPNVRSGSYKTFSRSTGAIGTQGFGFLLASLNPANDGAQIFYSDATYAASVFTDNTATTGVIDTSVNSPFTAADFGSSVGEVMYRTVAIGARIRYSGTELERQGRIICFEHPDHATLDLYDETSVLSFDQAEKSPVDREWHAALWQPIMASELEFAAQISAAEPLGCIITGTTGQTFDVEVVNIFEAIGTPVRNKQIAPSVGFVKDLMGSIGQFSSRELSSLSSEGVDWFTDRVMNSAGQGATMLLSYAIDHYGRPGIEYRA